MVFPNEYGGAASVGPTSYMTFLPLADLEYTAAGGNAGPTLVGLIFFSQRNL